MKMKTKKILGHIAIASGIVALGATSAFAAAPVDPFATGLTTVQTWFSGALAQLIALVALIAGVILAIGGRITTALGAFVLALIIGLGDTIVAALAVM